MQKIFKVCKDLLRRISAGSHTIISQGPVADHVYGRRVSKGFHQDLFKSFSHKIMQTPQIALNEDLQDLHKIFAQGPLREFHKIITEGPARGDLIRSCYKSSKGPSQI